MSEMKLFALGINATPTLFINAASCGYIVTHNIRDFHGSEKWGITAITPSDFLKFIETQT